MIRREGVAIGLVHGQHADHSIQTFERHNQRRLQRGVLSGIDDVAVFDLRIAIHDRLAVLRDPSAQSLAHLDFQRGEHAEIFSADQFGQQPAIAIHEHGNRVIGNHAAQAHRKHGEGFAQAQRDAEILAELEHGLRLLPRRGNRGEEVGALAGAVGRYRCVRIQWPGPVRAPRAPPWKVPWRRPVSSDIWAIRSSST